MNPKVTKMTPFIVMDVLERANALQAEGIDVIHLEVGEPDFNIPACVTDAATKAYQDGKTHYTHSLGSPLLRQKIADFYVQEYGVTVDPDCIVVTSGSSPAILMVLMLLCEAGSEVILSNPGYACYSNFALAVNANPVQVLLKPENKFQYKLEDIRAALSDQTRAIFVNSPMNPTGGLVDDAVFEGLATLNVPIISDEIYHGLVYEGNARSILEFTDNAFVVNGFSKRFAMTGLRLGYLIAPKQYMRALQTIQQNLFICAPSTAQEAGIAALTAADDDVIAMRAIYRQRRDYMVSRLTGMGFVIHAAPQGAFYVFCDARSFTSDSLAFCFDVLEKAHVGITPGIDFGSAGEGFLRFSYANSLEHIQTGLDRLEAYLKR
ncbi:MAG: pyridoxal phosphate-dependent aminotransferase [Bacteroidota bacterium]|nr:pyridoxal phosphate-dependent aminotransferase [Bacteroidota bacterium]